MKIEFNDKPLKRALTAIETSQLPYAGSLALTKTAQAARRLVIEEFKTKFDRPKPSTVNETSGPLYVKTASKNKWPNDYAEVRIKDAPLPKGDPALVYLYHHVKGGPRVSKRLELQLRSAGVLFPGYFAIPGSGARMDKYGNMSQGQVQEILSAFRAQKLEYMNTTVVRKVGKRTIRNNQKLADYFVAYRGGSKTAHLAEGIWQRYGRNKWEIRPVLIFVHGAPQYSARIRWDQIVRGAAQFIYPQILRVALDHAIATIRPDRNPLARQAA